MLNPFFTVMRPSLKGLRRFFHESAITDVGWYRGPGKSVLLVRYDEEEDMFVGCVFLVDPRPAWREALAMKPIARLRVIYGA